jgi:hypothetical protein
VLKARYEIRTGAPVLGAMVLGLFLWFLAFVDLGNALGMTSSQPLRQVGLTLFMLLALPVFLPLLCLAAMWITEKCLVRRGILQRVELREFGLGTRYPEHWCKPAPRVLKTRYETPLVALALGAILLGTFLCALMMIGLGIPDGNPVLLSLLMLLSWVVVVLTLYFACIWI